MATLLKTPQTPASRRRHPDVGVLKGYVVIRRTAEASLKLESGDDLLLESGEKILLEE